MSENRTYSDEDHWNAVAAYLSTASFAKAADIVGMPYDTLRGWSKQDWFADIAGKIKKEKEAIYLANTDEIIRLGFGVVIDRLKNGDSILGKSGKIIQKPVGAKDAALITSVFIDKNRLMNNQPTSISGNINAKLEEQKKFFENMAKAKQAEPNIEDAKKELESDDEPSEPEVLPSPRGGTGTS